jgi:hypothetical protein
VQQGSQISQIYGPGGLGKALSETGKIAASAATKFAPIAIAAGVAALGVAGLTAAIREETGVEVSWGDTALAVIQTIGDGIYSYIKPAIDAVAPWFQIAWDAIKVGSANLFNGIARSVLTTEATFKYIFGVTVPAAFKLGAEAAAKAFLGPIQFIVDQTIGGVNAIIRALNSVGANISELDPFKVNTDFGGDQALQDLAKGYEDYQKRLAEIQSTDYAAQFFDAVSGRAVVNHNNRQDDKKAGRESEYAREIRQIRERTGALHIEANVIGLSTFAAEKMRKVFELESAARKDAIGLTAARAAEIEKEANAYAAAAANLEYLTTIYDTGKSVIGGFFSDMKSGLRETGDLFGSLGAAGANAFDRIADKALELAANGIWDLLFNAFAGALGGGLGGGFSSQLGRGLTGASVFGGSTGFYGIPGFATSSCASWRRPASG